MFVLLAAVRSIHILAVVFIFRKANFQLEGKTIQNDNIRLQLKSLSKTVNVVQINILQNKTFLNELRLELILDFRTKLFISYLLNLPSIQLKSVFKGETS